MGDLTYSNQTSTKLARLEQSDGGKLVYHSPRRRPGGLFLLWIAVIAVTVLSLVFKWWFVFVVFTLCGLMGLIGLYWLYLSIRAYWFPWQLVLDLPLRTGSFFWKTPFKSHTQSFSFDDVKSINVGSYGDDKDEPPAWLVDISFHHKPSWAMGLADEREVAVEYAGTLATSLGTEVTENPVS